MRWGATPAPARTRPAGAAAASRARTTLLPIFVAGERYELDAGDVLGFPGNVPHSYRNLDATASAAGVSIVVLAKAGV